MKPKGKSIALLTGIALLVILGASAWIYRAHLRFWWLFESLGANAQGYPEYRHRQTGIVFVRVPGGTFMMGSPEKQEGRLKHEGPVHEVMLSPFLMAKYEVTQEQWKKLMGDRPAKFKAENLPVESLLWDDCQEFCRRARLSLPTEAQWEYACRAGSQTVFSSGNSEGDVNLVAWHHGNSGDKPHPVGSLPPNEFGLHDMHGNALEWCADVFDSDFYSNLQSDKKDPICDDSKRRD